MELWLLIVTIAVLVVIGLAYHLGWMVGFRTATDLADEHIENMHKIYAPYLKISQPTQQSGTHTPERGSDDTE